MNWTHEEKGRVASYLKDGLSAAQIAARFDGKTRNAIIGVVMRDKTLAAIGFARATGPRCEHRGSPNRRKEPIVRRAKVDMRRLKQAVFAPPPAAPPSEPIISGSASHGVGRPIGTLGGNQCRFAVNDAARGETHLFCGEPSDGRWCAAHRRIVYQAAA